MRLRYDSPQVYIMVSHALVGTQRLWVIDTPALTMNGSYTYPIGTYYNGLASFDITGLTLLTFFMPSSNGSRISLGGVNILNEQPSTFINFILDSP